MVQLVREVVVVLLLLAVGLINGQTCIVASDALAQNQTCAMASQQVIRSILSGQSITAEQAATLCDTGCQAFTRQNITACLSGVSNYSCACLHV